MKDRILSLVGEWATQTSGASESPIACYVFGSVSESDEWSFGVNRSDVDLMLVMPGTKSTDALTRMRLLKQLRTRLVTLHLELFRLLESRDVDREHVGVQFLTGIEAKKGIHWSHSHTSLLQPVFQLVPRGDQGPVSILPYYDDNFYLFNGPLISAMSAVQNRRNQYLKTSIHKPYGLTDLERDRGYLPKEILALGSDLEQWPRIKDKWEHAYEPLNRRAGLAYILSMLDRSRVSAPGYADLFSKVAAHLNTPDLAAAPIDDDTYMLLLEMIFDCATSMLQPTLFDDLEQSFGQRRD